MIDLPAQRDQSRVDVSGGLEISENVGGKLVTALLEEPARVLDSRLDARLIEELDRFVAQRLQQDDLEIAFDYYELQRAGLGKDLVEQYRRGLELILQHPRAWQPLDEIYRRYRFHRFPYGIVYRIDDNAAEIVIVAIAHLSERPGAWRNRER